MLTMETGARTVEEALRLVRALGQHRYVAGRLHMVHAFAFAAIDASPLVAEGRAWAEAVLANRDIDASSRDERLWRPSTEAEIVEVLKGFWMPGPSAAEARARLLARLERVELPVPDGRPFDEEVEDDIHPLLVDAGWELLSLVLLDPERHKGAILAFGEPIFFEAAKFEEEEVIPPPVHLQELPAIGPVELLRGADEDGALASELVVWVEGNATYHDYVLRGVRRAAKLAAA